MRTFVFIGFGKGLADPNFDALFRWARSAFATSEYRHYRLCLRPEKALIESDFRMADRVYAISYGEHYTDLPKFLHGIRGQHSSPSSDGHTRQNSEPSHKSRKKGPGNAHASVDVPPGTSDEAVDGDFLTGARTVQIRIAQMFRIADLLVFPDNVRARRFREVVANPSKLRRALNRPWSLQLGDLGLLKPTARIADRFDEEFWRVSIPDFRVPTSQWLYLVPFEVNLSPHRFGMGCPDLSCLGATVAQGSPLLNNCQTNGLLRIYPPGVGVVRLSLTLGFRGAVHLPTLLKLARGVEELLFVGPNGDERPCENFLRDIVDEAAAALFVPSDIMEDRRWRPPETLITLFDEDGFRPEHHATELSRLLGLGCRAGISEEDSVERMAGALQSPHWIRDHVLYAVGRRSALSLVGHDFGGRIAEKARKMRDRLAETWELATVSAYATQSFVEDMHAVSTARQLSADWLPGGEKFAYLQSLVSNFHAALQASPWRRFSFKGRAQAC